MPVHAAEGGLATVGIEAVLDDFRKDEIGVAVALLGVGEEGSRQVRKRANSRARVVSKGNSWVVMR